ncbi:MAG: hypothetical protein AAGB46_18760 [Verrucomicrobiota bacterium]
MSNEQITIRFYTENLHLDNGELTCGTVSCTNGEPLEIARGEQQSDAIALPPRAHIALGRFDPHVHFREAVIPTRDEVEEYGPEGVEYETLVASIKSANALYDIERGCLAALKGGVSAVGAMGNTPWGPVGAYRHQRSQKLHDEKGLIPVALWPRMEPKSYPISGHEGKDFGSTFGGSGLTGETRKQMYALWKGEAVSYHNDQARNDETIREFKDRVNPNEILLHHEYFNGETVLACQAETIALAREVGISSLLARHIPTGPALQQISDASREGALKLPAEVGLDYVYWCRERLLAQNKETALLNYRRPAHPSLEDQQALIELTRDLVRSNYPVFFGTDHAPHSLEAKAFKNGLPGSPGTRNIEHSLQFYMELKYRYDYSWVDIDRLASINPAKHMAQFIDYPLEVGSMENGAMANLSIFDPDAAYQVDEVKLSKELQDPYYHSAMTGEEGLRGQMLYTVSNGRVWDVRGRPKSMN